MSIFESLIGNEDIKCTLGNAISHSEFLHAYIIEGAYGTGKHTVARLASCAIQCTGQDCTEEKRQNICQKIMNDNCADVRFFDAFKVDDVRKIKETLFESPTECDYKIYILNNAEKMNIKAQNALLISLEDPPKNVVFFLLCTDATVLLETIRSRAQLLRTKPLAAEQISDYIMQNKLYAGDRETLDEIILSSSGSLGYALDMLNESRAQELLKDREKARELSLSLLKNDSSTVTLLWSLFNSTREKLKDLFSLSLIALRDLAVVKKAKGAPLCFFTSPKDAVGVSSKYTMQRILHVYSKLEEAIEALNTNSNVPNTLASLITNSKKKGN